MSRAAAVIASALEALREERAQLDQAISALEAAAGVKRRGRKPGPKPGGKPGNPGRKPGPRPGRKPGRPKRAVDPPAPKVTILPRGVSRRVEE